MATRATRVKGVARQAIAAEAFVADLAAVGSPATSAGVVIYVECVKRGMDCRFILGMFGKESSKGRNPAAIAVADNGGLGPTHSWGNTTEPSYGDPGLGPPFVRGRFTRYKDWAAGGISTVARFFEHPPYAKAFTVEEIVSIWAPPSENDTEGYINFVVAEMNRLGGDATVGGGSSMAAPKIAISAGHHNTSGGDAFEVQQTGPLAKAVADACRALGMDVKVLTPNDGLGMDGVALDVVARRVVTLAEAGWSADIYLETHTEGGGGVGVFAIYPDSGGDTDTDVRDKLGPDIAKRVAAATGLGLGHGGTGIMSEQQTGVGADGSRLGIFRVTAPVAATCTRLIVEYGAHDKQPDLGIAKAAGFADKCGKATAEAFAAFLGWQAPANGGGGGGGNSTVDPVAAKQRRLLAWANALPFEARGNLAQEGEADLTQFGGAARERVAIFDKCRVHTLGDTQYAFNLTGAASFDALTQAGKIHLF